MRKLTGVLVLGLLIGVAAASSGVLTDGEQAEFAGRRQSLMNEIPGGIAVFRGAPAPNDDHRFFQYRDFYYLTGVTLPGTWLIVDAVKKESSLFFTMDEKKALGEGLSPRLIRDPSGSTGIERVYSLEEFDTRLARLLTSTSVVYTPFSCQEGKRETSNEKFRAEQKNMLLDVWDGRLTRELQFVKVLREKFLDLEVNDCSPLLWKMRLHKSLHEIDLIRDSAQIAVKGHLEFMRSISPGVTEKELAALFEYICSKEGADDQAYEVIIMSGPNHWWGHYHIYDRVLDEDDFVILDAGPDMDYYKSDVSSTFPASGKFSARQREIYQVAYEVHQLCLSLYRPGVSLGEIGSKVEAYMDEKGYDKTGYKGIFKWGGYNHPIGMTTHDVMQAVEGPDALLKPGYVFACDINVPYAEEELGIRIEDTVVITEDGCEILSAGLPRSIEEIEKFMREEGIIQALKEAEKY
jgi:Xaa-Pro aminopeptidase